MTSEITEEMVRAARTKLPIGVTLEMAAGAIEAALAARPIEAGSVVRFLHEAAHYFENCPSKDEDRAFWATVYNAENCRKAADLIQSQAAAIAERDEQLRDYEADQIAQGRRLRLLHARAERLEKALRELESYLRDTAHHNAPQAAAARAALQQEGESDAE